MMLITSELARSEFLFAYILLGSNSLIGTDLCIQLRNCHGKALFDSKSSNVGIWEFGFS